MKEIIVIKDSQAIDEWKRTIACYVDIDNSIYKAKFEKVPETWEELKELCKNIKGVKVSADCISIGEDNHETYFLKDGTMGKENGEDVWWNTHIAVNRTPQQMWNVIKNLIGEQNGNKNKI